MEVPIVIYSLLLIAILALNIAAHFLLRDVTSEGRGKDMAAPRASRQEEWATSSFVDKVGGILGSGEQRLAIALHQGEQERGDEIVAMWVGNALNQGIINDEEVAQMMVWWSQRPKALQLGWGMVGRHSLQPSAHPFLWQHTVGKTPGFECTTEILSIEQEGRVDAFKKAQEERTRWSGQRDEGLRSGTGSRRL